MRTWEQYVHSRQGRPSLAFTGQILEECLRSYGCGISEEHGWPCGSGHETALHRLTNYDFSNKKLVFNSSLPHFISIAKI